jgi:hypothetical protein
MKSMLSDLDFSNVKLEPGDKTNLLTGGTQAAIELIRRYNDNLVRALEAALVVIDFEREAANTTLATSDPEGHRQSITDHHDELVRNLETALEPFKVVSAAEPELHDV